MQIIVARELLKLVRIGERQVKYIVEQARRGRVQGHRAEIFAVREEPGVQGLGHKAHSQIMGLETFE